MMNKAICTLGLVGLLCLLMMVDGLCLRLLLGLSIWLKYLVFIYHVPLDFMVCNNSYLSTWILLYWVKQFIMPIQLLFKWIIIRAC